MEKIIIAAVSANNVISKDGKIPWHSKEEILHFKKTTLGFPIIMGRKTWETFDKPLKGRLNVIISRNPEFSTSFHEAIVFHSLKQAFSYFRTSVYDKIFVIGGGEIFEESIAEVDTLIISKMNFECEGDVYFPEIKNEDWVLDSNQIFSEFTLDRYIRNKK